MLCIQHIWSRYSVVSRHPRLCVSRLYFFRCVRLQYTPLPYLLYAPAPEQGNNQFHTVTYLAGLRRSLATFDERWYFGSSVSFILQIPNLDATVRRPNSQLSQQFPRGTGCYTIQTSAYCCFVYYPFSICHVILCLLWHRIPSCNKTPPVQCLWPVRTNMTRVGKKHETGHGGFYFPLPPKYRKL